MKKGDLVRLKNLHESWGYAALITNIHRTDYGTGQIYLITKNGNLSAIPWIRKDYYISGIISEGR